jgi:hypothetical protein
LTCAAAMQLTARTRGPVDFWGPRGLHSSKWATMRNQISASARLSCLWEWLRSAGCGVVRGLGFRAQHSTARTQGLCVERANKVTRNNNWSPGSETGGSTGGGTALFRYRPLWPVSSVRILVSGGMDGEGRGGRPLPAPRLPAYRPRTRRRPQRVHPMGGTRSHPPLRLN